MGVVQAVGGSDQPELTGSAVRRSVGGSVVGAAAGRGPATRSSIGKECEKFLGPHQKVARGDAKVSLVAAVVELDGLWMCSSAPADHGCSESTAENASSGLRRLIAMLGGKGLLVWNLVEPKGGILRGCQVSPNSTHSRDHAKFHPRNFFAQHHACTTGTLSPSRPLPQPQPRRGCNEPHVMGAH